MDLRKLQLVLAPHIDELLITALAWAVHPENRLEVNLDSIPRGLRRWDDEIAGALAEDVHGLVQFAALTAMSPLLAANLNEHAPMTGKLLTNTRGALDLSAFVDDVPVAQASPELFQLDFSHEVADTLLDEMLNGFCRSSEIERPVRSAIIATLLRGMDSIAAETWSRRRLLDLRNATMTDANLGSVLRTEARNTMAAVDGLASNGRRAAGTPGFVEL